MYLQRIELSGFKSFANKTVLEFPTPGTGPLAKANGKTKMDCGITAIVGPNGSGKSNVVDAVRWVLGEQSLKLLRGKKATDIIFAGSSKKAQMGLAEVSLFLNNEDRLAPIDYSEIVITRKLYRDGNSEYLLNKQEVRLFDIVMLLAKANFGQNTYSIIGQGMIDKIVNYSSQERKEFFDEATGVKQYQIKRDRSVNKLKRSRENIAQVDVLLKELDPHLKSLTRQVERLHKRQAIEVELKELQSQYYGRMWFDLDATYKQLIISFTAQDKTRLKLENEITSVTEQLEKLSQENARTVEFDKMQSEYGKMMADKNEVLKELTIINAKADVEYAKIGKQNLSWLESRKQELENRVAEINETLRGNKLKSQLTAEELSVAEKNLHALNSELTVSQNNLQILQDELYRLKSGTKSNYALDSVKAVLYQKNNFPGIYGTVADIGKIDRKYETALATAAGNRLWAIVVDTDETAVKCIKYLKDNRLGSATFFPLSNLTSKAIDDRQNYLATQNGAVNFAINLVSFETKFAKVFQQVFGSTLIVETVDDARNIGIGRERMVTLDGDVFDKSGVIRGGYKQRDSATWTGSYDGKFATQEEKMREITSLRAFTDEKYRERELMVSKINDLKLDARMDEDKIRTFNEELAGITREKNKILAEIKESDLSPEERKAFAENLLTKKDQLQKSLAEFASKEDALRQKIDNFNLAEEQKKREVFNFQQSMHQNQNELNRITTLINDVKIELAKVETKKEDLYLSVKQDLGEDHKFNANNNNPDLDLEETIGKINRLKKQLEIIGGTDPEVEKEYEEVKKRFEHLSKESEDLAKAITDLEKVVVELDKMIRSQFEKEFEQINNDFSRYFKQLFDGGSAKLVLTQKEVTEAEIAREEVNNLTEAGVSEIEGTVTEPVKEKKILYVEDKSFLANMGIDIEACPPGKKIKNINVLSGGEKTMTALALICAIIANNPSPFILFDEVDAALDEANSSKLSNIVEELNHKTQFIVITHNRAIMARANVLYGVTMQGDGISRLIGLKLEEAEKMATEKIGS